jgi:hypothetical protein
MDDNRLGDQMKRGVATAVETGNDLAGKAQTAATEAGNTIQNAAMETAKQVSDATSKHGAQAAEYVSRNTTEKPLLALLIAGAIGYGIAYMVHGR